MANKDLIPTKDGDFDNFQSNLIAQATTNMTAWNIPATVLTEIAGPKSLWDAAWLIAKVKTNRTPAQVAAKSQARKNYEDILRYFIQVYVYRNFSMTNEDIVECGLKPRDNTKTPVPIPTQVPVINNSNAPGSVLVTRFFRLDDETGAVRRGKPKGVARVEMAFNFTTEPADPDACAHRATATRSPLRTTIPVSMRGQKIWYYVRWVNTREQPGPWSNLDSYVF